jgi:hypothetical protein
MPGILSDAVVNELLSPEELAKGIADTWTLAEWPARLIEPWYWTSIFALAIDENEFITDDGVIVPSHSLPERLVLYRGAWDEYSFGMSWTSDISIGRWFAHRFDGTRDNPDGHLYTITVDRSVVIGRFDARRESEFVLDITLISDEDVDLVGEVATLSV